MFPSKTLISGPAMGLLAILLAACGDKVTDATIGYDCDGDGEIDTWTTNADDPCGGGTDGDDSGSGDDDCLVMVYGDTDLDGYPDEDNPYIEHNCDDLERAGENHYFPLVGTAPSGYEDYEREADCDDTDADINPDADEVCDGQDNNCDGSTDESGAVDASTWYVDADVDGFGSDDHSTPACNQPLGYVDNNEDCDDANDDVHPDATEVCNEIDDDCDSQIDDADGNLDTSTGSTFYGDSDGDGFGVDTSSVEACEAPSGYATNPNDCDDSNADINPGAEEDCDQTVVDYDCDGNAGGSTAYADDDGDGWADIDDSASYCSTLPSGYIDGDGDGDGDVDALDHDCDDTVSTINPGASELCSSAGVDDDCDGTADESDAIDASTWYADDDGDGYGDPTDSQVACTQPGTDVSDDTDCDDDDSSINPGATEVTADEIDQNCDSQETCYADSDSDTYGADDGSTVSSTDTDCADSGESTNTEDCDDADGSIYPGAAEYCDGVDEDCDGTEDNDAVDGSVFYADADFDGYCDVSTSGSYCSGDEPSDYSSEGDCDMDGSGSVDSDDDDCDDTDDTVYPTATEDDSVTDRNCDDVVHATTLSTSFLDTTNYLDDVSATLTDSGGTADLGEWAVYTTTRSTTDSDLLGSATWSATYFTGAHNALLSMPYGTGTDECADVILATDIDDYALVMMARQTGGSGEMCFYLNGLSAGDLIGCFDSLDSSGELVEVGSFTGTGSDTLYGCSNDYSGDMSQIFVGEI